MDRIAAVPLPPLDEHALLVFWCQILVVLAVARGGGFVARRLGQPRVIGELAGGVLLGPSVLAEVWPRGSEWLFPPGEAQAGPLLGLAWVGVVMLLGVTGAEVDLSLLRGRSRAAITTTLGSLLVPLAVGAYVASKLPAGFQGPEGTRTVFLAFFAVAFAISSLPVAARILGDLGLLARPSAQLAMGVATANDVVGWLLLGVVVGMAESGSISIGPIAVATATVILTGGLVLTYGHRVLDRVGDAMEQRDGGAAGEVTLITLAVVAIGTITHAVGTEVVIGAFFAGIAVGRSRLRHGQGLVALESATNGLFAPLFFAIAGIRVDLTALTDWSVARWALLVTVTATVAKLGGAYLGGRLGGLDRVDAASVGASLNARGALEIVVATVGLSIGVIDSIAYTVIVFMALVTSALAGPLLRMLHRPLMEAPDPLS